MKIPKIFTSLIICSSLLIQGCSSQASKTIKIATKPMSEQFIISEIIKLLIEDGSDLKVKITKGIGGGTANIMPAMIKGDFDLYSEYSGTGYLTILKESKVIKDEAQLFEIIQSRYNKEYQMSWIGKYGFNNTYTLALRKEVADKYQIKTFSDLAKHADQITFGGNADFSEREDGLKGLKAMYGFNFKAESEIDIALKYTALENKQVDVINAYTTDSQLSKANVVLLKDDQNFFQNYYAYSVVRQSVLNEFPQLEPILLKMENLISNEEMAQMNYALDIEKKDEAAIAKAFLIKKGLIK